MTSSILPLVLMKISILVYFQRDTLVHHLTLIVEHIHRFVLYLSFQPRLSRMATTLSAPERGCESNIAAHVIRIIVIIVKYDWLFLSQLHSDWAKLTWHVLHSAIIIPVPSDCSTILFPTFPSPSALSVLHIVHTTSVTWCHFPTKVPPFLLPRLPSHHSTRAKKPLSACPAKYTYCISQLLPFSHPPLPCFPFSSLAFPLLDSQWLRKPQYAFPSSLLPMLHPSKTICPILSISSTQFSQTMMRRDWVSLTQYAHQNALIASVT